MPVEDVFTITGRAPSSPAASELGVVKVNEEVEVVESARRGSKTTCTASRCSRVLDEGRAGTTPRCCCAVSSARTSSAAWS